jgi:hypothetical protein
VDRWGQILLGENSDSRDPRWRVRPLFIWLVAATLLAGVVAMFASRSPPSKHPSSGTVRAEFQSIAVPAATHNERGLQTVSSASVADSA